jgi:hypothetical protein
MININGTETLAFGIKSEHQLVRKGSFIGQRAARKPSSISLMFANNVDPNTIDDTVTDGTVTATTDASILNGADLDDSSAPDRPDFDAEEKVAFCEHLNNVLKDDKMMSRYIPLDPYSEDLYSRMDDGVILCKVGFSCYNFFLIC